MRNILLGILVFAFVMGSLRAQNPMVDSTGWYFSDCVGTERYEIFAKQGTSVWGIGNAGTNFTPTTLPTSGNLTTATAGNGQFSNFVRYITYTLSPVNGRTFRAVLYIHKDFAITGNNTEAILAINETGVGGSPPIYFTNSVSVVSLGAISVSGRNMDSVCYVRFVLPDAVSIAILLETNGVGTGGGVGTACPHCGVVGCDGSCQGTNPIPCPHCGVVGCTGSCIQPPDPPDVDYDLEGVIQLLQHLITLLEIQISLLQTQNILLQQLLDKGGDSDELLERLSVLGEYQVGMSAFVGGMVLFGIFAFGFRLR
jgi:hypothetical protein